MVKLERTYTIPLRANYAKVPKYYRSKRAINHIKAFIARHMKVAEEDVKLGRNLNEKVWQHGIKNPPGKVKIKAIKDNDKVTVELEGFEYKVDKVQVEKTEKASSLKDKLTEKLGAKENVKEEDSKEESETEEAKPEKKPSAKKKSPAKKSAEPETE